MKHATRSLTLMLPLGLSLGLAGCARNSGAAGDDGLALASAFLDDLRAGKVAEAFARTTTDFKSLMGQDNLRDYARTHPALMGTAELTGTKPADRNGIVVTEYTFRATAPPTASRGKSSTKTSPAPSTIKVLVMAEGKGWAVEHLSVD
ncbi:hypothetical protein [Aquisphaera insulae]|uniref:hypothetical protein n=1 Tax=Aquisphaera insulae TaxID=2712864 RepID=UPI0013EB0BB2|nr:hypothetical protein [Aquisphaera insulae]